MAFDIGLNVVEVDGSASPAITGAATSVAAFNVATQRGPVNRPVRVTSFAQFAEVFGGADSDTLGAFLVRGFFDNGGRRAWVNRVSGANPAAAACQFAAGQRQTLKLEAGYRGQRDPGAWANRIAVGIAPSFSTRLKGQTLNDTNGDFAGLAGLAKGDTVVLTDGAKSATVTIADLDPATGKATWKPAVADIAQYDKAKTRIDSTDFDLSLTGRDGQPLESFERLTLDRSSPRYAVPVLNDVARGSRYVMVTDSRAAGETAAEPPGAAADPTLQGGVSRAAQAADYQGEAAQHTGFHAFDAFDVQLVGCDNSDVTVIRKGLDYCERRGDCMFVGAVPQGSTVSRAIEFGAGLQGRKVYGALYGPWIRVSDPLSKAPTPLRLVPPTGHVMGVYARIETDRGIHKAPAGDEARLLGALDVEFPLSDADHNDLVKQGGVNGIRAIRGAGIVVDASRTLSTDTRWLYVNVRLLFNYVKSSLRQGLRWVRQEPNRDTLWDMVKFGTVRPFLMGLWRQGAFGTGEPDDVFTIVCDASNNPPDQVDKGNFTVEVYFYPSKPAETIVIVVGQQPSGGSASEG
ncbi:tail protein [Planobispora rosea]|uniref:phage tail sheath C-terminal domain-containing protein n=2 Tax=Planobispora rosea TaxID=35762 RepID=UPI00083B07B0|nr:phage tail sheath C-terminal domain-containing protein [Planobispora rosea]GGS77906.1 tail protein [Planobispora rosea]